MAPLGHHSGWGNPRSSSGINICASVSYFTISFTVSFKLYEWLHLYHRVSYPMSQIISRLQLSGNTKALLIFTSFVPFSYAFIFC